ncbi:hydroxymethylglutaryl-CoA lyase [Aliidongia dinghuensis]|uniref:Hydroxymethylglutaryl-CoA lyase n=1 Tax=Aliidongia dinghuensis TaxID=1867774 RepID=A0A8J3E2D7_9PROT|nr:hydroxymethylglutaryl-CoA lyase [Aliidongia dinghuensis]GGF10224.1 hydroxymethylglutaryl-CoA lyase [Aliidongia dinghuensis]
MTNPWTTGPKTLRLRDVTLRDGLQNLETVLPTEAKLTLYRALVAAGVSELQVTSFVNPARVPALADAEALWAALAGVPERLSVLVANPRGLERARAAGVGEVEAVVSASRTYNEKNAHRTPEQSMDEIARMAADARTASIRFSAAVANAFHCFFEGDIAPDRTLDMVGRLVELGITEIGMADTTGHARPDRVWDLFDRARRLWPNVAFGGHTHDTRGRGLVNALAAVQAGAAWLDATLAGLGGSPFTAGVGGNLSIETAAEALAGLGIATGVDPDRIMAAGEVAAKLISG